MIAFLCLPSRDVVHRARTEDLLRMLPTDVQKSVPGVRIHLATPTSLRFEAFSGEVRKLHACRGDAHGPSAPENAQMVSRRASLRFSLCGRVIRCRCPLLANATFGQGKPISRAIQRSSRASVGRKAFSLSIVF